MFINFNKTYTSVSAFHYDAQTYSDFSNSNLVSTDLVTNTNYPWISETSGILNLDISDLVGTDSFFFNTSNVGTVKVSSTDTLTFHNSYPYGFMLNGVYVPFYISNNFFVLCDYNGIKILPKVDYFSLLPSCVQLYTDEEVALLNSTIASQASDILSLETKSNNYFLNFTNFQLTITALQRENAELNIQNSSAIDNLSSEITSRVDLTSRYNLLESEFSKMSLNYSNIISLKDSQIFDLKNRISNFPSDIVSFQSSYDLLLSEKTQLESSLSLIPSLHSSISSLETQLSEANTNLTILQSSKTTLEATIVSNADKLAIAIDEASTATGLAKVNETISSGLTTYYQSEIDRLTFALSDSKTLFDSKIATLETENQTLSQLLKTKFDALIIPDTLISFNGKGCEYVDGTIVSVSGSDGVYVVIRSFSVYIADNSYTVMYDVASDNGGSLSVPEAMLTAVVAPVTVP